MKQIDQLLITLYVDKKLSPREILKELHDLGHDVSINLIGNHLKKLGILRSPKEEIKRIGRYKPKHCLLCNVEFQLVAASQIYCKTCVPNHAAGQRVMNFGLSQPCYDELLRKQHNACAVCERSFQNLSNRQIVVDHCHRTNVVRGIVCARCNVLLAAIDTDGWIEKAKHYVMNTGNK
jgi:hypothetical protein